MRYILATWRRQIRGPFSDWTIVLTSSDEDEERVDTYHVHKLHLRDSKYFEALLAMSASVQETKQNFL